MLIYKDIISGDELFSDAYPQNLVDDLYYEVEGKNITISNDIDEALIGGNKATDATEEDETVESTRETGIDVIIFQKLIQTSFDKNTFKDWLKTYMKALKTKVEEKNASRVAKFTAGMQNWAKETLKNFDNFNFYLGEKMDPEGMVILQGYRADNITPYFVFFKDGLEEEKC